MRLKRHASLLESSLRHVSARPLLSLRCNRRGFAASSAAYPEQIAILGGGISGLASAHFIAKEFPQSKITIFEQDSEVGGWIKSKRVEVEGGSVLFEYGPRTLRPGVAALPTAQLIQDLGLVQDVLYTSKESPAAKNRYIYYPDRLNRLPASTSDLGLTGAYQLFSSGILAGMLNLFWEPMQPKRPQGRQDESISNFIRRRVDGRVADNLVSPVFHGIYAGDINQLSARTLLSTAWALEGKFGSVGGGIFQSNTENSEPGFWTLIHPYDYEEYERMNSVIKLDKDFRERLAPSKTSTFAFRNGLQQLVKRLEESLRQNDQIEIQTDTRVVAENLGGGPKIAIGPSADSTRDFDFVVSTLPDENLTDSVTVMVVNLFYQKPPSELLPGIQGFGYLIPRSVPFEQNPERALGVIFDHDAVQGQDTVSGTKLTVMLGGHWWADWEEYPDPAEGAVYAKSVIERHLGIKDEPDLCHATLNRNCIPQYTVGYEDRLKHRAEQLLAKFGGRMRAVGSQYNGVGVNDCIRGAWQIANGMKGNGWKGQSTGLDRVTDSREWVRAIWPKWQSYNARTPIEER